MKKIISMMIVLAIMIAVPMGALAQVTEPDPGPITPEPTEPEFNYTEPYWYYWPVGGFDYADGVANGTYVDFLLDEPTGTISDYTTKLVDYNFYYDMMYYDGYREDAPGTDFGYMPEPTEYTVTFFDTITIDDFVPNGHPGNFGQSLIYMGENVMMTFSDYEWSSMYFQFGEENGTMTFTVPDGIEISEAPNYYELYGLDEPLNTTKISEDGTAFPSDDMFIGPMYFEWDEAWLSSGNLTCSIWVDRGSIEIVGNQIVVSTYADAFVSTSSWIEYAWQYQYSEPWFEDFSTDDQSILEGAVEAGLMAAIGYLYTGNGGASYNDAETMNDPSFKLEFMNVEQNQFQVQVQSEIKNGRIVTLNVNKEALNVESMKELKVLLDDEKIGACGSMEELVDLQGGTESGYYMVSGNNQNTIFVYVPHFSTRIITVGLADSILGSAILPAVIAAVFIAAAVGLVYLRGKKNRDEL
ncbi:MAG: hypothetical protein KKH41_08225 [Candidatus Thermoplasmatota archaeon]|nr:hypothetical protein [Euryarchaeota archaeon]MBU4032200.1 hypothetical protein [Candidatus Thermoplasmatota archaeon]MBU4071818.1 hypothetical protein [Candidatus Thermoplasmatota archaeon]MBU4143945.1 hypothetical protein [Candidatus Thermoplasmatota archaeon]MBU4592552.1 hypothetical protein [Candidatus Thermoplasmatota archaeon]